MKAAKRGHLALALLAYVIALAVRLAGIAAQEPQADELLWVQRSAKVISRYHSAPQTMTSHLGHPGVPPALIMAAAQSLRSKVFKTFALEADGWGDFDALAASRAGAAAVSALLAPLVYLSVFSILGGGAALLAAALTTLDPRLLGLGRLAHLDAILTVLVLITVWLYWLAVQRGSVRLKIASGFFWGLSIATKPTAAVLPAGFLILKTLRRTLIPVQKLSGDRTIISWGDLGAVLIGQLTLAAIFTRLWLHKSDYLVKFHIRTPAAKWLWRTGVYLHDRPYVMLGVLVLVVFAVCALCWLYLQRRARWQYHAGMGLGLLGMLTFALYLAPQVFENLVRFWVRSIGLVDMVHRAYGHASSSVPQGYWTILSSGLPEVCLAGVALAVWALARRCIREGRSEAVVFLIFLMVLPVVWVLPLEASAKQALRYALPIVPCIYILAAFGWWTLLEAASAALDARSFWSAVFPPRTFLAVGFLLVTAAQGLTLYRWWPYEVVYFNGISGGMRAALDRQQSFFLVGQTAGLDFLMEEHRRRGAPLYITVFGDRRVLEVQAVRRFGMEGSRALKFGLYRPHMADYLMVFASHEHLFATKEWRPFMQASPVFAWKLDETVVLRLYELPWPDYREPLPILAGYPRQTGKVERDPVSREKSVIAIPPAEKGDLYFNEGFRLPPGEYTFAVPVSRLSTQGEVPPPNRELALRLELGDSCQRHVVWGELPASGAAPVELRCVVVREGHYAPRVYWYGTTGIKIGKMMLKRIF